MAGMRRVGWPMVLGVAGFVTFAAPAWADDTTPAPPPPGPDQSAPAATPASTPAVDGPPAPGPVGDAPAPVDADGVPHLSSPQNLPPGTVANPPQESGRRLSYLRDLWHAVQTQEVSGSGALLLLTQMPMDPESPSAPRIAPPSAPPPPAPAETAPPAPAEPVEPPETAPPAPATP